MRVVVTGGAGYLGAHVARLLLARGDDVVVIDDLSTGIASRLPAGVLHTVDLTADAARGALADALKGADAVVHFAARKRVDESLVRPAWYYRQNIASLANVLEALEESSARVLVFSSSAAVYGETQGTAIRERDPALPINPYGATKLAGEQLTAAAAAAAGLRAASLRYFNVAGAGWADLADTVAANLIPIALRCVSRGRAPTIYGDDYPTPDGTCIRDYVHVLDLAEAHIAVLDFLASESPAHHVFNVGTGSGSSVAEVVSAVNRLAATPVAPRMAPRRAGDPAVVVADATLIRDRVGWVARRGLGDIVRSAWDASVAEPAR